MIITLALMAVLIGYRVYLFVRETDYQAINAKHIDRIETRRHGRAGYRFAVVGNIRNSMRIFERRITPLMNSSGADFMISLGNAVYDGAEGKYRLLYRGLKKLKIPYVLSAGHNEVEDFGAEQFYRHFGPYFFSFHLENTYFIFLDSTGQTAWEWQMRWLRQELTTAKQFSCRFMFLNHSVFTLSGFNPHDTHYVLDGKLSRELRQLFSRYRVTAVFSAGYPTYHERVEQGVRYIISGGCGGLLIDRQQYYQIVNVAVGPDQEAFENVKASERLSLVREKNLDFLIDGLAKVKKRVRIPFKCLLVGEGPEKRRFEEKAAALGLNEQVVFTGNMSPREVALGYLAADLFIFASTSETQGMVLIEAMAGGCPVVAVRASGVYDVVRNGYNGLMVGESTESWSKAVATLLAERRQLAVLFENSRVFAEDYSEDKIAEKVLRLYRRVVVLGKTKAD